MKNVTTENISRVASAINVPFLSLSHARSTQNYIKLFRRTYVRD